VSADPVPVAPPLATGTAPAFSAREVRVVLVAMMAAVFVAAVDQTAVAAALPTIAGELGGLDRLAWIVAAYLLASCAATPLYGRASDIWGRRPLYLAGIGIFVVGSLAAAFAQDVVWLIAARVVQGAGAGGLIALAQVVLGDMVSPRERGRYNGYVGGVFAVASVAGPLVGGLFVDAGAWRGMFLVNVPVALVAAVVVHRSFGRLPRPTGHASVDWIGVLLFVLGLCSLLLGLSSVRGGITGWTATLLGAGVVVLVLFGLWERRVADPLLPLRSLSDRTVLTSGAISFLLIFALVGSATFLPIYLQIGRGLSATAAGLLLVPQMVGLTIANVVGGRLLTRYGRYKVISIVGTAVVVVSLVALGLLPATAPLWVFALVVVGLGLGMGSASPTQVVAAQNSAKEGELGVVTSAVIFFRSVGGLMGVAALGTVLAALLAGGPAAGLGAPTDLGALSAEAKGRVAETVVAAVGTVSLVAAGVALLSLLLSLTIVERPLRTSLPPVS
jgi:EmrB/QacA subfamily drug resistance transporter